MDQMSYSHAQPVRKEATNWRPTITQWLWGLFGLSLAAIGTLVRSRGQDVWLEAAGALLQGTGAVFSTGVFAWFFGRAHALKQMTENIDQIALEISSVAAQARVVVDSYSRGLVSAEECISRIDQTCNSLGVSLLAMGRLTGNSLEAYNETWFRTHVAVKDMGEVFTKAIKGQLADVGAELQRLNSSTEAAGQEMTGQDKRFEELVSRVSDIMEALDKRSSVPKIATDVTAVSSNNSAREFRSDEFVACPYCSERVSVSLGNALGDSAMPACPSCKRQFHAHRGSRGIFASMPGKSTSVVSASKQISVKCAGVDCGCEVPLRVVVGDTALQKRFCFNCGRKLAIDPVKMVSGIIAEPAIKEGEYNSEGDLICPDDQMPVKYEVGYAPGRVAGVCIEHDCVVRADR